MKIKIFISKTTILMLSLLCLTFLFSSCFLSIDKDYYANKNNYLTAFGTVTHIKYNDKKTELYLGFSDLTPKFDDNSFRIVGDNLSIVQQNGIDEIIEIGDSIEFITAPEYFGDGYVMPIVGLKANDKELLNFEEGFDNFQKWLNDR